MKSVKFVPRGPGIYIDGSDKTYFNNNKYTSVMQYAKTSQEQITMK